jgi:hypothetical protein
MKDGRQSISADPMSGLEEVQVHEEWFKGAVAFLLAI